MIFCSFFSVHFYCGEEKEQNQKQQEKEEKEKKFHSHFRKII